MIVDFLTLAFGITGLQDIKKAEGGLNQLRMSALAVGTAFITAGIGLERFLNTTISKTSFYKDFQMQTGLAIDKLQQLEYIGQNLNINLSTDKIRQSIMSVQKSIMDIKMGRGDATPFIMAGVENISSAYGVIGQLRNSLQNVDDATASNLIQRMGFSPEFLSIIRASNQELLKLSKNRFLTQEQINIVNLVGKGIKSLKTELILLKDQAIAKLSPQLNILIGDSLKWLRDNSDKISKGIEGFVNVFISFTKAVGNSLRLITEFIDKITGTDDGIKILASSFAVLILAVSPVLRVFTALAFILDDIYVWSKGGESSFGGLYDVFAKIYEIIMKVVGAIDTFLEKNQALGQVIKPLLGILKSTAFGAVGGSIVPGIGTAGGGALGFAKGVYDNFFNKKTDNSTELKPSLTDDNFAMANKINNNNNSSSQSNTNNNNFTFNIDGAKNPQEILDTIKNYIQQENNLYQSKNNAYSGL
jgi:hypothetical protein